jgi:hypothetical protein
VWTSVFAALIITVISLAGCGGGGGVVPQPPAPNTGQVTGRVVQADDTNVGLSGARITLAPLGGAPTAATTGTADNLGRFNLPQVPVGTYTFTAETPGNADYRSQNIPDLTVTSGGLVTLTVSVLHLAQPEPTIIYLTPTQVVLDLNAQVDFNGAVASGAGIINAQPTYVLEGDIGSIDANGLFTAGKVGSGRVLAFCGTARASAPVQVVGPRPPDISTFFVNPQRLGATGGTVNITAAVNDGDGLDHVRTEVYAPNGDIAYLSMSRTAGTSRDGTYQINYVAPGNSNTPDAQGRQAEQRYSVRVVATDNSGASQISGFVNFVVEGLTSPPSPF